MEQNDSANPSLLPRNAISDVPYTILGQNYDSDKPFSWETMDEDPLHLKIRIKNIELEQDPSEVLHLEMHLDSIPTQDEFKYLYKVTNMEIKFQNKLHEFDKNYVYEILCRYSTEYADPDEYLFSFAKPRSSSVITETEKRFSALYELKSHLLHIYIRRLYRFARENEVRRYIDFDSLLENVPRDINLVVGDQRLPAHQLVLSHSSDLFKSMFSRGMETKTDEVVIENFSVEVINEMLNFLYTGKIGDIGMRYELLKVAHEYQLKDLRNRCEEWIIFNLERRNFEKTMEIVDLYNSKLLKASTITFMRNYEMEIIGEPSYHNHLCRTTHVGNAVNRLYYGRKHHIESVAKTAFDFMVDNYDKMKDNVDFLILYKSNPSLVKEISKCNFFKRPPFRRLEKQ